MEDVIDAIDAVDVDQIETEPVEQEEVEEVESPDPKIDGRRFNPEWSKSLKELRELYPDRADMLTKLRDSYGRYGALTEIAPKGIDEVRTWKSTIEALGGPESAAQLMERAAQMDAADERIAAGDFSVLGELPENVQKGLYQMLPDMLSNLATSDEKAFAAAVQPHFQEALKSTGLGESLKELYGKLGENVEAKDLVKKVFDWYSRQTQGGEMPKGQTVSPQVKALQDKLAKYESTADTSFTETVANSSLKHLDDSFAKIADVYIKQRNLTQEQQDDLKASLNAKVTQTLEKDAVFQAQLRAFRSQRNRNPEQVTNFIKAKLDEVSKPALDQLVLTRYGKTTAKAVVPKANGDANKGAVRVAQAPAREEWDMDRMEAAGYENSAKKGIFYLKGGRTVQLQRA